MSYSAFGSGIGGNLYTSKSSPYIPSLGVGSYNPNSSPYMSSYGSSLAPYSTGSSYGSSPSGYGSSYGSSHNLLGMNSYNTGIGNNYRSASNGYGDKSYGDAISAYSSGLNSSSYMNGYSSGLTPKSYSLGLSTPSVRNHRSISPMPTTRTPYIDTSNLTSKSTGSDRYRAANRSASTVGSSVSEPVSRADTPARLASRAQSENDINNSDDVDYKKLYEELKGENDRLKEKVVGIETELKDTKSQLDRRDSRSSIVNSNSSLSGVTDQEKRERRALERKISEMEEELKQMQKIRAENEKLKAENRALTRVVSKLTK